MYFMEEKHTRWGHDRENCRIKVIRVPLDSSAHTSAVSNSKLHKEEDEKEDEKLKTHLKTMTDRFIECCATTLTRCINTGKGDITDVNVEVDECTLVVFIDGAYNAWKFEVFYDEDMLPLGTMLGDEIKEE